MAWIADGLVVVSHAGAHRERKAAALIRLGIGLIYRPWAWQVAHFRGLKRRRASDQEFVLAIGFVEAHEDRAGILSGGLIEDAKFTSPLVWAWNRMWSLGVYLYRLHMLEDASKSLG